MGNCEVHGIDRRAYSFNSTLIGSITTTGIPTSRLRIHLHNGELAEATNITRIIQMMQHPEDVTGCAMPAAAFAAITIRSSRRPS
jgi:GDP-D-mannose dehydratase